jgi:hypothetical protein
MAAIQTRYKSPAAWWTALGLLLLSFLATTASADPPRTTVRAVEISEDNAFLLPKGKEADGIIGDFVLLNDRIRALVSANLPMRKASFGGRQERRYPTPGSLYDFDLAPGDNDQLTLFRPGALWREVSYVRIVSDGEDGAAVVEVVRTAAKGDGLYTRHEYRLEPGWQYLLITSTYRNESAKTQDISPLPLWRQFSQEWRIGGIRIGDSTDPFDKRAFAWTFRVAAGSTPPEGDVRLDSGQEASFVVAVAVGDSPLAAYGVLAALTSGTGVVEGRADDGVMPAAHASLLVQLDEKWLPAYTDASGRFAFHLPAGRYNAKLVDLGRPSVTRAFSVQQGISTRLDFSLPPASGLVFDIHDEAALPCPAKVQVIGVGGTPSPQFGPEIRARGCDNRYFSPGGRFTQPVPPGRYKIRITHGPEYDLFEQDVEVRPAAQVKIDATLRRTVDTRGWISADYHSHTTESGDNYTGVEDRLISLAAENIEFAAATEHNRIFDWQPTVERLGLQKYLKTICGLELTAPTTADHHMNAFPLPPQPHRQDGGAPPWQPDPRVNAITLRDIYGGGPNRWVHLNHPPVGQIFNDRDRDGIPDGGFKGLESLIDAMEVWSTEILNPDPSYTAIGADGKKEERENRTFGWLQLLNQGSRVWMIAVSDAHRVCSVGVGAWRTYVRSSTDEPDEIDPAEMIRSSKAGQMMITNGPFLTVTVGDGQPIGSTVVKASSAPIELKVKVQRPDWIEIDRVQILINGRQDPRYNFNRKSQPEMFGRGPVAFEQTIAVDLRQDAHLIVVAAGEASDLTKGWGETAEGRMHPLAYTNPIFVDTDGNGFQPNGDTLGHPMLVSATSAPSQ